MGERHQIFAIARIKPYSEDGNAAPKYRCVAALHHQWCSGRFPAKAIRRCLTLVKQENNAEIIRAELTGLDGKYGRWGEPPEMPEIPCPYIAFLLGASYSTDLETEGRFTGSNVSLLWADMGSSEGDNNDGVSVIDVTDPISPSYCFVSLGGLASQVTTPHWTPLSAEQYVRAYHLLPSPERLQIQDEDAEHERRIEADVLRIIADLSEEKIIPRRMLEEAWPEEYLPYTENAEGRLETLEAADEVAPILSLWDLALRPAISYCSTMCDFSGIEDVIWQPGKASLVHSALRALTHFPDSGVSLLLKTLPGPTISEGRLDLSEFHLSTAQILNIVMSLGPLIESINLSFNRNLSIHTIRSLLTAAPHLRRLVIMSCPNLQDDEIVNLFRTESHLIRNLDAFIHPLFLSFERSPLNALTILNVGADHEVSAATVPYLTPASAVQNLTDYLAIFTTVDLDVLHIIRTKPWIAWATFCAAAKREGQKWSERSIVSIPSFSQAGFSGEGWVFALYYDGMLPAARKSCAFLKFKAHPGFIHTLSSERDPKIQRTWEIYHLRSFLDIISENREPAPPDAVDTLDAMFNQLLEEQNFQLMDDRDVQKYLRIALQKSLNDSG